MTELETLKKKCLKKDGTPRKDATGRDLARLKQLQDAEPLSQAELDESKRREEERHAKEVEEFKKRQQQPAQISAPPDKALDKPVAEEHPRIKALKEALLPFTNLECHESRPDDFILINRGVAITAGDVRKARKAMRV